MAGIVVHPPAESVTRGRQPGAPPGAATDLGGGGHQRRMQGGQQRRRQHVGAVAGLRQQPLRHVADAGVDPGRGRHAVVGRLRRQRHPAALAAHVRSRPARAGLDALQAVAGIVHAQRLEDAAGDGLAEELAGGGEHHVADQAEAHVLVGIAVARRAGQWHVGHAPGQAVVIGVGLDVAVERVARQAQPVAEDVGHGDGLRGARLRELERRDEIGELAVPAQHAVVDQHAGDGAGERLGQRRQAEHGVRVDRLRVAGVGDAIAARAEDAAVLDDRHRKPGDAAVGHQRVGDGLEAADVDGRCRWTHAGACVGLQARGRMRLSLRLRLGLRFGLRGGRAADLPAPPAGTVLCGRRQRQREQRCNHRPSPGWPDVVPFHRHWPLLSCGEGLILAPDSTIA